MKPMIITLMALVLVSACSYPTTELRITDNRPAIAIKGASEDAVLYVDGLSMGLAQQFDGHAQVLLLEPGTHKIEVISQGKVFLSEKVFLGGGEVRTLSVSGK